MNIDSVLEIQLDSVGQRLFSEICCEYYKQPPNSLKFTFNTTHGEFSCQAGQAICFMYLASNTSDRRWAIQYIDTVAYGPNPGATHINLVNLLQERSLYKLTDLNSIAFNTGCAVWEEITMPFHVSETKRIFKSC